MVEIDLAKKVVALHGVDATGKAVLVCHAVPCAKLLEQSAKEDERARQPMHLDGIGTTTASTG